MFDNDEEIMKLRNAIRAHRDQKGDDRCWMDDIELYKVLPEGVVNADLSLLSDEQFRRNCDLFIKNRKCPVPQGAVIGKYVMDRLRDRIGQRVVVFVATTDIYDFAVRLGLLEKIQDFKSISMYDVWIKSSINISFIGVCCAVRKILSREGDVLYENLTIPKNYGKPKTPQEVEELKVLSFGKEVAEKLSKTSST